MGEFRNHGMQIAQRLAALVLLGASACATASVPAPANLRAWAGVKDCFDRDVAPTATNAETMAITCSGPGAAADPGMSGIDRATAYFNAASALNLLADAGGGEAACDAPEGCFAFSLRLLEKSRISQDDLLMEDTATSQPSPADALFVLRRGFESARAMKGLADAPVAGRDCGSAASCLSGAASLLADQELGVLAGPEQDPVSTTACRALDLRARISLQRGPEHEHAAISDLRDLVRLCPVYSEAASGQLAQIAFNRGEFLRQSMENGIAAGKPASETASLAASALSSYRDGVSAGALELPGYRGIGSVLVALASLEPANAAAHFAAAAEALELAQQLSTSAPAEAHAGDLSSLSEAYFGLANSRPPISAIRRETALGGAMRSIGEAIRLAPTYDRFLLAGRIYTAAGRTNEAISAYRSALTSAGSVNTEAALLSLAGLLEASGAEDEALQVLESGAAATSGPPAALFEIGRLKFRKADHQGALSPLLASVDRLGKEQSAHAHYMISVSETVLRHSGWLERARIHADAAVQANSFSDSYVRQDCLTHILQGGREVKSGASLHRCPVGDSAESFLLRGMYFLRQAQLSDVSAYDTASQDHWRGILRLADDAFRSGQQVLSKSSDAAAQVRFDDLGRDIDLTEALGHGILVSSRCRREASVSAGSETWNDLEAFYGHYGILKCSVD